MNAGVNALQIIKRSFILNLLSNPYLHMGLLAIVYLLVRAPYWSQHQIYDGKEYYNIAVDFTDSHFDLLKGTADHNSQLWMALASLPNLIFRHDYIAFNIWISILSALAAVSIYEIIRHTAGNFLRPYEVLLAAAIVAFNPSILCNLIHFSPDTGIFLFMTFTCLALLKKQRILAVLCGCVLVFSKEQGVAYLGLLHALCAYREPVWKDKCRFMLRNSLSLLIPYALIIAYMVYKTRLHHQPFFFDNPHIFTGIDNQSFLNYVLMCFVLNTNWLIILITALGALKITFLKPLPPQWATYRSHGPAYALLFATVLIIVLAVRHWANDRYLLAFNFALMLCFIYVLPAFRNIHLRSTMLASLLVLLTWQNYRTIDPLSLTVFCTTHFGTHVTLHIPWDDACLFNPHEEEMLRDQYVYNLEFTNIARVQTEIIRAHSPKAAYAGNNYYSAGFLSPVYAMDDLPGLLARKNSNDFYVIKYPGAPLGHMPSYIYADFEQPDPPETFTVNGYSLDVHHFVRTYIVKRQAHRKYIQSDEYKTQKAIRTLQNILNH